MNERPLNERPAARPIQKKVTESPQGQPRDEEGVPATTSPESSGIAGNMFLAFFNALGVSGKLGLAIVVIFFIYIIGNSINASMTDESSGSITYDQQPQQVDPRSTFNISEKCEVGMAASASDPSENGERLLKETGNLCSSQEEWEAALYKYPRAIGMTEAKFLDGSEFGLLCGSYPEVKICRK